MVKRTGRELSFSVLVGFTWKVGEKGSKPICKSGQALKLFPSRAENQALGYCGIVVSFFFFFPFSIFLRNALLAKNVE